jgi:hypothetical protein
VDAHHFDTFVRSLGLAVPRRAALGGAIGTSLAILLASLRAGDIMAKKRKKRKKRKCKGGKKKCGKTCVDLETDGNNCGFCGDACATGACVHGACTCEGAEDCIEGCLCAARVEGGDACQSGVDSTDTCNEDADCPFGSFCRLVGNDCSIPCFL